MLRSEAAFLSGSEPELFAKSLVEKPQSNQFPEAAEKFGLPSARPAAPKGAFMLPFFWFPASPAAQIFTSSLKKFFAGAGPLLLFSEFLSLEIVPLTVPTENSV